MFQEASLHLSHCPFTRLPDLSNLFRLLIEGEDTSENGDPSRDLGPGCSGKGHPPSLRTRTTEHPSRPAVDPVEGRPPRQPKQSASTGDS